MLVLFAYLKDLEETSSSCQGNLASYSAVRFSFTISIHAEQHFVTPWLPTPCALHAATQSSKSLMFTASDISQENEENDL